jgi:hypothetical protein
MVVMLPSEGEDRQLNIDSLQQQKRGNPDSDAKNIKRLKSSSCTIPGKNEVIIMMTKSVT